MITGGFIAGRGGNTQTVNHPTVGRTPEGAIVERAPPTVEPAGHFKLQLHQADFTTSARVAALLNKHFLGDARVAHAESAGVVVVEIPASYATRPVEFVAEIEDLSVDTDQRAKVVINERTGTIVVGKEVRISPVVIMHGALNVEISTKLDVSQPEPLSQGKTTVTPNTTVKAKEDPAKKIVLQKGATIEDLVRALQAIGSTPRDVIAILQTLSVARRAGRGNRGELMTTGMISATAAIPDIPQAQPKKAADAAKQFEGLLLGQMLKSARDATSGDEEDSSGQTMLDVADQQFAQVLANRGGIGLAQLAVKGLNQGASHAHRK